MLSNSDIMSIIVMCVYTITNNDGMILKINLGNKGNSYLKMRLSANDKSEIFTDLTLCDDDGGVIAYSLDHINPRNIFRITDCLVVGSMYVYPEMIHSVKCGTHTVYSRD